MPTFFGIYVGEEKNFGLRKFSKVGRGSGLLVRILAFDPLIRVRILLAN